MIARTKLNMCLLSFECAVLLYQWMGQVDPLRARWEHLFMPPTHSTPLIFLSTLRFLTPSFIVSALHLAVTATEQARAGKGRSGFCMWGEKKPQG